MPHREPHAVTPATGEATGMRGCERAAGCTSERAGHGLNAVQERLAAVTASRWIDAIVTSVDTTTGYAWIATLDGGIRRVWQHDAFGGALAVGDPVALHGVYGVLAAGDRRFSVADA
ncbi:hypothetical protein BJ978_001907 [Agromyces terreus]|uniref:Uncharacterized protein n=1 Tax=Agromyces terreus TaxID=424795 RepID=A0A9X2KCC1_9MICO|nr:hypothetical protein [Agromyces terreus]MCP2371231.1 hypothetical protein [Agromyces terreus]